MKIALAFFGLPRCSRLTFESIRRNLIEPLAACGELGVFYHFMRQSHVRHPRTGVDEPLSPDNYEPFLPFEGFTESPETVLDSDLLAKLQTYGDAWNDDFRSLRNLVLQLHSVQSVHRLTASFAPDAVVFARPDMLYHDAVQEADVVRAATSPRTLCIPDWQWWLNGYNDRFSVCGRLAAKLYADRKAIAPIYCRRFGLALHSEQLLRAAADGAMLEVHPIPLRASRVRVSGLIEQESFEASARTRPPGP